MGFALIGILQYHFDGGTKSHVVDKEKGDCVKWEDMHFTNGQFTTLHAVVSWLPSMQICDM